jgi:hypothetical protein
MGNTNSSSSLSSSSSMNTNTSNVEEELTNIKDIIDFEIQNIKNIQSQIERKNTEIRQQTLIHQHNDYSRNHYEYKDMFVRKKPQQINKLKGLIKQYQDYYNSIAQPILEQQQQYLQQPQQQSNQSNQSRRNNIPFGEPVPNMNSFPSLPPPPPMPTPNFSSDVMDDVQLQQFINSTLNIDATPTPDRYNFDSTYRIDKVTEPAQTNLCLSCNILIPKIINEDLECVICLGLLKEKFDDSITGPLITLFYKEGEHLYGFHEHCLKTQYNKTKLLMNATSRQPIPIFNPFTCVTDNNKCDCVMIQSLNSSGRRGGSKKKTKSNKKKKYHKKRKTFNKLRKGNS